MAPDVAGGTHSEDPWVGNILKPPVRVNLSENIPKQHKRILGLYHLSLLWNKTTHPPFLLGRAEYTHPTAPAAWAELSRGPPLPVTHYSLRQRVPAILRVSIRGRNR